MQDSLSVAIRDYDHRSLANQYGNWASLSARGRFACLNAILIDQNPERAVSVLALQADYFRESSLDSFFQLSLDHEAKGELAPGLAQALLEEFPRTEDAFVRGEYLFLLGLVFLKSGHIDLAAEFYRRADSEFGREELLFSYQWRTQFNLALCELRRHRFDAFELHLAQLERQFSSLTKPAQLFLSRLRVWLYLHLDRPRCAQGMIEEMLALQDQDAADYRISYLLKYYFFILLRTDRREFERAYSLYSHQLLEKERLVVEEFDWICAQDPVPSQELWRRLEAWRSQRHLLDLYLLTELALLQLEKSGQHELLAGAYRWVKRNVSPRKPTLPACDFREFGLVAYQALNRPTLFRALLDEYTQTAQPWRKSEHLAKLKLFEEKKNQSVIALHLAEKKILWLDRELSMDRRPRLLVFLHQVFLHKTGVSVRELGRHLYGDDEQATHDMRITALAASVRKLFQADVIEIRNGVVRLKSNLRAVIYRDRSLQKKSRQSHILEVIRGQKAGVSIRALSEILRYSRRSLQADLRALVERGQLRQTGKGRSVLYLCK